MCVCAFISICLKYLWKEHKNFTKTGCLAGRGTGQPGSKENKTFHCITNSTLLLNFEPRKYIAIKKKWEEKATPRLFPMVFSSGEISMKALEEVFVRPALWAKRGGANI